MNLIDLAKTTYTESRVLTQEELSAEATDRFGDLQLDWAFQCPSCGDVATGRELRAALVKRPRKHWQFNRNMLFTDLLGLECIGRTLGKRAGRGCKYTAYGLIHGPWQVAIPGHKKPLYCFPLAAAPSAVRGEN